MNSDPAQSLKAELLDLRLSRVQSDIPALVSLTSGRRRLLEVGCGTGRLIEPLAKAGAVVIGVEINSARASFARHRLAEFKGATVVEADFLDYRPMPPVDVVVFALNVFAEFLSVEGRVRALRHAAGMLERNGEIVLVNDMHDFKAWAHRERRFELSLPVNRLTATACTINCTRKFANQTSRCVATYTNKEGSVLASEEYTTALLTRNELLALFGAADLSVVAELGSYQLEPLSEASEVLIHRVQPA